MNNDPVNFVDLLGLAPKGHHYVPKSLFKKVPLPKEIKSYFNKQTTGSIPGGHGWSKAHKAYNEAVNELWDDYLNKNKINPCAMTLEQATGFLDVVKNSNSRRIKPFLKGISLAQKGIGPFATLGLTPFSVSSIDASFRADPVRTLELITPDY